MVWSGRTEIGGDVVLLLSSYRENIIIGELDREREFKNHHHKKKKRRIVCLRGRGRLRIAVF